MARSCVIKDLIKYWQNMSQWLQNMGFESINYLEIDLTNAYCPLGCCRLVDHCSKVIKANKSKRVNFLGVQSVKEMSDVMKRIRKDLH